MIELQKFGRADFARLIGWVSDRPFMVQWAGPVIFRFPLDEAQLVYLADKLVMGNRLTGVAQRFKTKIKRHGQVPELAEAIQRRRQSATAIQAKLETITKQPICSLLKAAGLFDGESACTTN